VARAQAAVGVQLPPGEGQHAAGGHNAITTDNGGPVVQGCFVEEDSLQQFGRYQAVYGDAGIDVGLQESTPSSTISAPVRVAEKVSTVRIRRGSIVSAVVWRTARDRPVCRPMRSSVRRISGCKTIGVAMSSAWLRRSRPQQAIADNPHQNRSSQPNPV
jgi:hypothetical protein